MSEHNPDQATIDVENNVGMLRPFSPSSATDPVAAGFPGHGSLEVRSTGMGTPDAFGSNVPGFPKWVEARFNIKAGRDPLGLQTITVDRIMPRLLPGVLALSQRARYFSFYPFLLAGYQARKLPPTNNALSTFVKAREYEYALAVQLCPKGCGSRRSSVVGKERVEPTVKSGADLQSRGESVQSYLGGYGLYYRSPLIDLQVVAPRGTHLADNTTPSMFFIKMIGSPH